MFLMGLGDHNFTDEQPHRRSKVAQNEKTNMLYENSDLLIYM